MNSAIIHSNLSRSPQFLRLSDGAALLMLMALPHCDDYGRLPADADWWAINVCPGRKTIDQIEELLGEILDRKDKAGSAMLTSYSVDDTDFYFVTKWFKYQSLGSGYVVRAECPHPVLGVVEPNVMGSTINQFFRVKDGSKDLESYNICSEKAQAFLDQGKNHQKSDKRKPKSDQVNAPSDQKESESNQIPNGKPPNLIGTRTENGESSRVLIGKGPSSASASAQALAHSPSQASATATSQSQAPDIGAAENPSGSGVDSPGLSLKSDLSGPEGSGGSDGALALQKAMLEPENPNVKPNLQLRLGGTLPIDERKKANLERLAKQSEIERELADRAAHPETWRKPKDTGKEVTE